MAVELSNRFGASAHTGELEMFVWPLKIAHLSSSGGELPPEVAKWFTGIAHRFLDQFIGEYTMALRACVHGEHWSAVSDYHTELYAKHKNDRKLKELAVPAIEILRAAGVLQMFVVPDAPMQLGFAASGNDGKGVHDIASLNVAATIGEACKRIKKNDAFDPFQFTVGVMLCQKIPMFGPDSLSDWTCHVLRPLFVEYTDECCIGEPVRPELVQDEVAEDSVFLDFWRRMRKKIDAPWSSSTADPNSWSTRAKRLCVPSAVLSPKGEFDAARAFVMSTMARKITGGSTFVKNVSDIVSMLCNCPPLEAIVVPECCLALVQASLVVDVHTTKMYNAAVGAEGPVGEERKTVDSGVVSFFYGGGRLHCVCGSDDTEAVAFARVQASRCWVLLLCDVLEENFNPFRLWLANSRLTIRADLAQIEPLARPTSLLPQGSIGECLLATCADNPAWRTWLQDFNKGSKGLVVARSSHIPSVDSARTAFFVCHDTHDARNLPQLDHACHVEKFLEIVCRAVYSDTVRGSARLRGTRSRTNCARAEKRLSMDIERANLFTMIHTPRVPYRVVSFNVTNFEAFNRTNNKKAADALVELFKNADLVLLQEVGKKVDGDDPVATLFAEANLVPFQFRCPSGRDGNVFGAYADVQCAGWSRVSFALGKGVEYPLVGIRGHCSQIERSPFYMTEPATRGMSAFTTSPYCVLLRFGKGKDDVVMFITVHFPPGDGADSTLKRQVAAGEVKAFLESDRMSPAVMRVVGGDFNAMDEEELCDLAKRCGDLVNLNAGSDFSGTNTRRDHPHDSFFTSSSDRCGGFRVALCGLSGLGTHHPICMEIGDGGRATRSRSCVTTVASGESAARAGTRKRKG